MSNTPYNRLTGTWVFYTAAPSTAAPNLDATPSGSWTLLGATEGDQNFKWLGEAEFFTDNNGTSQVKGVRPISGIEIAAALVNLTLENRAIVRGQAAGDVTSTTSGAYSVKRIDNALPYVLNRYALLARGGAEIATNEMSPYVSGEAQIWVPIVVFTGDAEEVYSKAGSPALSFMAKGLRDDTQSAGQELGWMMAKSA